MKHIIRESKKCPSCKKVLPRTGFYINHKTNKPFIYCIECSKAKKTIKHYERKYGITLEDYNIMFLKQEGKCAICGTHQRDLKGKLNMDHDHITDKVRGLLCRKCNWGLGQFNDRASLLEKAIIYLDKYEE